MRVFSYLLAPLAVGLTICLGAALAVNHLYSEALAQAENSLRNLGRALAAETESVLRASETALRRSRDALEKNPHMSASQSQTLLATESESAPYLRVMSYYGADGILKNLSNQPMPENPVNFSQRKWFVEARERTGRGMVVADPIQSLLTNLWLVPLVFRIEDSEGRFGGAVAGSLDPVFFQELFKRFDLGAGAAVTLQRADSMVLARHPHIEEIVGKTFADRPFVKQIQQQPEVHLWTTSPFDQKERLVQGNAVNGFPIYITISMTKDSILQGWRNQAGIIGVGTLVLLAFVAILGSLTFRAQRLSEARAQAEAALADKVQELSASESLSRQAQEISQTGTYAFDIPGNRWQSSEMLDRIFGIAADYPHTLESWLDLIAPEMRDEVREYTQAFMTAGEIFDKEYWLLRASDGQRRWVKSMGRLERDAEGRPLRMIGTVRDLTDQKRDSDEISRSNADLEQFAYVASHDLREPLRMISSYTSLIERRLNAQLDGETQEFLGYVKEGAKRLDHLILDLLDYSRVGRVRDAIAQVNLGNALSEALHNLEPAIRECNAEIETPSDMPTLNASRDEMVRLFQNLIGNALRYRSAGHPCRISISVTRAASFWKIAVQDNGIGIPPNQAERIFGIFQRLHTREAYGGGSGIGLAICKKIVERHGGRIWVESDGENQGATFLFTLPLGGAAAFIQA